MKIICHIKMTVVRPLLSVRGMKIGAATALASAMMDQENVLNTEQAESWTMVLFNLLFLGPCVFSFVTPFTVASKNIFNSILDTLGLVTIHSMIYSIVHRAMHRIKALRPMHNAHHKYKDIVLPSNANAVSSQEFLWAYMMPFVTGCLILKPSTSSLTCATVIVSMFNLLVHSKHAIEWKIPDFLVTPFEHLQHHKFRSRMYSAPISWDKFFKKILGSQK